MVGATLVAVAPVAVLMQRQVEAESMLAPMLLGALLLIHRVLRGVGGRWTVGGLLLLCALAPLVKVSGVALAAVAVAVLVLGGRWRLALACVGAGLAGTAVYFVYGASYDLGLFIRVIQDSESRRYGVMGVYEFITAPAGPGRAPCSSCVTAGGLLGLAGAGLAAHARPRPPPATAGLAGTGLCGRDHALRRGRTALRLVPADGLPAALLPCRPADVGGGARAVRGGLLAGGSRSGPPRGLHQRS